MRGGQEGFWGGWLGGVGQGKNGTETVITKKKKVDTENL